jgi:hypothetical protein
VQASKQPFVQYLKSISPDDLKAVTDAIARLTAYQRSICGGSA